MDYKQEKVEQLIQKIAGEFLARESNRNSLITVTRVYVPADLKRATIMVTVLPIGQEDNALNFLKRNRSEFKEYFMKNAKMGRIPFFDFIIDRGEKMAQRIRELSEESDDVEKETEA